MARQVTLVCGPPCAGKSTWVDEHASTGDLVVDFDRIARRLGSRSKYDHPQHVKDAANAEVERLFRHIEQSDDVTAWVIRSLPVAADRAALAGRLRAGRVLVMRPTVAEIRRRAAADNRPAWTVQAARKWWEQFTPHELDETPRQGAEPDMGEDMPDNDPAPDTGDGPDNEPDPTPTKPATDKDWQAEADKWKALARKHETEAKNLRPLADKAKELEDAGRSDLERLTADLQAHQLRVTQAESELMRLRVAMRKGLTETQARRLVGSTEDELETDADDLLASFRPPAPEVEAKGDDKDPEPERDPNPRRRPQERLRPGAVPDADTEPVETDPRKLAAMVRRDVF